MLKYAIYENESFAKLVNLIVVEGVSKRSPTWYAKFDDKTMLMIQDKYSYTLEEKYQNWIKNNHNTYYWLDNIDLQIIFEYKNKGENKDRIRMRYRGAVFMPENKRSGFEVGYIIAELDENKKANTRAAYLYRITDHVIIAGDKKGVEDFMKQFKAYFQDLEPFDLNSDYMYDAISGMNDEDREGLMNLLKIECGAIVRLVEKEINISDEEDEEIKSSKIVEEDVKSRHNNAKKKYLIIKGILVTKAFGIIYNHPAVVFERSKYFNIYPNQWIKNNIFETSIIQLKKSFPYQTGLFKIPNESDEFNKVSEYFYKSMDKNVFEITTISRYQNPIKYESYYYNLRNVQIKSTSSI